MLRIQQELNLVNPFIHSFNMMAEVIAEEERKAVLERRPAPLIQMVLDVNPALDRRRYNVPVAIEVVALYVFQDDDAPPGRQYAIQSRGGVTEYRPKLTRSVIRYVIHCSALKENSASIPIQEKQD
ncbi:unnamed protein product [Heligmosomoides polygyrus]|uniref:Uma2 domain-containing protein n=1 Tax=Heligmosomoides polygyrus TaxID=6339 RepID=A0A183GEZ5_HELPZ|nr:unnamed protein product [Heligmosomoides polygyrus]